MLKFTYGYSKFMHVNKGSFTQKRSLAKFENLVVDTHK